MRESCNRRTIGREANPAPAPNRTKEGPRKKQRQRTRREFSQRIGCCKWGESGGRLEFCDYSCSSVSGSSLMLGQLSVHSIASASKPRMLRAMSKDKKQKTAGKLPPAPTARLSPRAAGRRPACTTERERTQP